MICPPNRILSVDLCCALSGQGGCGGGYNVTYLLSVLLRLLRFSLLWFRFCASYLHPFFETSEGFEKKANIPSFIWCSIFRRKKKKSGAESGVFDGEFLSVYYVFRSALLRQ